MTRRTRTRRRGGAVCRHCGKRVAVLGSPFRPGRWMTFEQQPVDPRVREAAVTPERDTFPVYNRKAYDPDVLLAELQSLTGCTVEEARQEVQDQPWHRLHRCLVLGHIAGSDR